MGSNRCVYSPLKPDELQVLRGQYEKEGDFVGVQTKFNYAWVRYSDGPTTDSRSCSLRA